eukprot:772795-Rhodomonas_salina.1
MDGVQEHTKAQPTGCCPKASLWPTSCQPQRTREQGANRENGDLRLFVTVCNRNCQAVQNTNHIVCGQADCQPPFWSRPLLCPPGEAGAIFIVTRDREFQPDEFRTSSPTGEMHESGAGTQLELGWP